MYVSLLQDRVGFGVQAAGVPWDGRTVIGMATSKAAVVIPTSDPD